MAEFGKDIMFIFPGRAPAVKGSMHSARYYLLTYQDYLDIRNRPRTCATPARCWFATDLHAVSEFPARRTDHWASSRSSVRISFLPLKAGRWLNDLDGAQRRNVIVLGERTARRSLFPGRPAVGAAILLNGIRFEV